MSQYSNIRPVPLSYFLFQFCKTILEFPSSQHIIIHHQNMISEPLILFELWNLNIFSFQNIMGSFIPNRRR